VTRRSRPAPAGIECGAGAIVERGERVHFHGQARADLVPLRAVPACDVQRAGRAAQRERPAGVQLRPAAVVMHEQRAHFVVHVHGIEARSQCAPASVGESCDVVRGGRACRREASADEQSRPAAIVEAGQGLATASQTIRLVAGLPGGRALRICLRSECGKTECEKEGAHGGREGTPASLPEVPIGRVTLARGGTFWPARDPCSQPRASLAR
jgi:hypothetical protein